MMRAAALLVVLGAASAADAAPALEGATDPYEGVHHEIWVDAAIPARVHLVRLDLSAAALTFFATAEAERGARTSEFASQQGAHVAINGDAFAPSGYVPLGLAVGASQPWSQTSDDASDGFLRFGREGERTIAEIVHPEAIVDAADLPASTQGVISGRPLLVRAGQPVTGFDCDDEIAIPCLRAPRSAVALSADGNTLWLAVVDGWQAGSAGMTATELAAFLDARGAHDALALDGGGAATLVIAAEGGVVSSPSDGAERVVANHLAIRVGDVPGVTLAGFVRERDVFSGADVANALVTLDDGRTDTTDATGFYSFADVTPRYACVTVDKTGYRTASKCKQVIATENPNYNSVPIFPCSDFPEGCEVPPDAAPPDAPPSGADAGVGDDGGIGGTDAGDGGGGGAPGCCAAGGERSDLALAMIVLVALRAPRRSGDRRRRGA